MSIAECRDPIGCSHNGFCGCDDGWPTIDRRSEPGAWGRELSLRPSLKGPPAIKFKRLPHGEGLPLPSYQTAGAAGMDICAADNDWRISPGSLKAVRTGFAVEIPEGWELQVRPRSGLASKHKITVLNTPGTIDSDYRGEIIVLLINHGREDFWIDRGDRIAQLVLAPVHRMPVVEVDELSQTARGEGGFGSTGLAT